MLRALGIADLLTPAGQAALRARLRAWMMSTFNCRAKRAMRPALACMTKGFLVSTGRTIRLSQHQINLMPRLYQSIQCNGRKQRSSSENNFHLKDVL